MQEHFRPANFSLMRGNNQKSHRTRSGLKTLVATYPPPPNPVNIHDLEKSENKVRVANVIIMAHEQAQKEVTKQ